MKTARRQNLSTDMSGGATPEPRNFYLGRKPSNLKLLLVGLVFGRLLFSCRFPLLLESSAGERPFAVSGSEQSGAPASARRSSGGRKFAPLIE